MTAYGQCHRCGRMTGCDPGYGPGYLQDPINPGAYRGGLWECYDCDAQLDPPKRAEPWPDRLPGESRQQWRKRMREARS